VYPERVAASAKVRVCVDFLVEALAGLNAAASDDAG
jgi:LysR family transcriptional activator of dmlA